MKMTDINVTLWFDGERTETTLRQFADDNDMNAAEMLAVRAAMEHDGAYRGGGGAQPEWELRLFSPFYA